uniref:fimbrial protein n=1 Tax=Escherichia coli TaxID=562 RepID=UPI00156244A0
MKRVINLFAVLLMGWSVNAWSFACKTANGTAIPIGGGSAQVFVKPSPAADGGEKPSVEILAEIFLHKDYPDTTSKHILSHMGSAFGGRVIK